MSVDRAALAAIRQSLEQRYALALEGLTEDQIAIAVASAIAEERTLEVDDPRLLPLVVDRLPIDESWLFRDDALWTWLQDELGPALLERAALLGRAVRALSLGCSSGQEAFSLAILFQGLLEARGIPGSSAAAYVEISGLDASPGRIAQARDGYVNGWSMQRCRADWLRGRVVPAGGGGGMRVAAPIRAMCRFEVGNVLNVTAQGNDALAGYDLVLCRHVLIYFRADRAARVVADLGRALDHQAVLVVSAAEAHLLAATPFLEPLGHLGAARAGPPAVAKGTRSAAAPRRPVSPARLHSRRATAGPPGRAAAAATGPTPREHRAAEEHLRRALEHAGAGRGTEALQEARAAFFLEPRQLFSRLLLGRELLSHDRERGREVLRDLVHHASLLPPEADVPFAPGLSVAQVARAARLLLDPSEGA